MAFNVGCLPFLIKKPNRRHFESKCLVIKLVGLWGCTNGWFGQMREQLVVHLRCATSQMHHLEGMAVLADLRSANARFLVQVKDSH